MYLARAAAAEQLAEEQNNSMNESKILPDVLTGHG